MNKRHRKALGWTLFTALLAAGPIWYLANLHKNDVTADMGELGMAEEFFFTFTNKAGGFTHHDTRRQVTVIAVLPEACAEGCPEVKDKLASIVGYVKQHLTSQHKDVATPLPTRFLTMARFPGEQFAEGWDHVVLTPEEQPLLPPGVTEAGLVVLDDASRYRAHIRYDDPQGDEKMQRLLAKITSHQYLVHYLVKQTLMWEKAKAQAKGNVPAPTPE